jgi:hypothetical protein
VVELHNHRTARRISEETGDKEKDELWRLRVEFIFTLPLCAREYQRPLLDSISEPLRLFKDRELRLVSHQEVTSTQICVHHARRFDQFFLRLRTEKDLSDIHQPDKMIEIPPNLDYEVDEAFWLKEPDLTKEQTKTAINTYITWMLVGYRNRYARFKGEDLWELFHEDFEGFTHDIFKLASRNAVRELRVELVSKGVWVKPAKGSN